MEAPIQALPPCGCKSGARASPQEDQAASISHSLQLPPFQARAGERFTLKLYPRHDWTLRLWGPFPAHTRGQRVHGRRGKLRRWQDTLPSNTLLSKPGCRSERSGPMPCPHLWRRGTVVLPKGREKPIGTELRISPQREDFTWNRVWASLTLKALLKQWRFGR